MATGHSLMKTLASALRGRSPRSMAGARSPLGEGIGIRGAQCGAKKASWRKRCWGEDLEKAVGGDTDIWMDREECGRLYMGRRYEYM